MKSDRSLSLAEQRVVTITPRNRWIATCHVQHAANIEPHFAMPLQFLLCILAFAWFPAVAVIFRLKVALRLLHFLSCLNNSCSCLYFAQCHTEWANPLIRATRAGVSRPENVVAELPFYDEPECGNVGTNEPLSNPHFRTERDSPNLPKGKWISEV